MMRSPVRIIDCAALASPSITQFEFSRMIIEWPPTTNMTSLFSPVTTVSPGRIAVFRVAGSPLTVTVPLRR
jgi:hypothetical protein